MKKPITGIESIRIRNRVIRDEVIDCCGINEDVYNNMLFERGIEWINTNMPKDDKTMSIVSSSSFYWQWFKNHWFTRENDFLADYWLYIMRGDEQDKKFLYYNWLNLHRIDLMKVFPSGNEWDAILKQIFNAYE